MELTKLISLCCILTAGIMINQVNARCSTGCLNCFTMNRCTKCKDRFYLQISPDRQQASCGQCQTNCAYCTSSTQCITCDNGYHIESRDSPSNHNYCQQCPVGCTTCTSSTQCTSCTAGLYGNSCSGRCPTMCKTCRIYDGSCIECHNGYYVYGDRCRKCNVECKECAGQHYCTSCQDGYYLSRNNCVQCPIGCATCGSIHVCYSCNPGYYLASQQCQACHNCLHQNCTDNGDCKNGCVTQDRFGTKCENTCNGEIRHCSECVATNAFAACEICQSGYYPLNNQCAPCPVHCANQQCDTYGYCNNGCVTQDRFGPKCERSCSTTIPYCSKCNTTTTPVTCNICKPGHYLTENSCAECSDNCRIRENCNNRNGACLNGCEDGWTGDKCNEKCLAKCVSCKQSRPDACNVCKNGFYGLSCEHACSDKCGNSSQEQICFKENGTCSQGCIDKYWGQQCYQTCNDGCGAFKCFQSDGTCIGECKPDRHGDMCDKTCSSDCFSVHNESNICDRRNGSCLLGCTNGLDGPFCDIANVPGNPLEFDGNTSNNSAAIGGASGGAVAIAVLIGVVLFFVIRKRRRSHKNCRSTTGRDVDASDPAYMYAQPMTPDSRGITPTDTASLAANLVSTTVSMLELRDREFRSDIDTVEIDIEEENGATGVFTSVRKTLPDSDTYYNIGGMERSKVPVDQLQAYVGQKTTTDFEKEFQKLPNGLSRPYQAAMQNRENNRYKMIYPYDASRVVLRSGPSDYINASHIDCYNQYSSYIASLGPTMKTMGDFECFWTMIWQEKVEVIVMLTNLIENGGMKCDMYWPEVTKNQVYDDVAVTCHSEDMYAEYTVRSFSMKKENDQRTVYHIHFTAWPDKSVPDDVISLLEFRQRVISCPRTLVGPTVVHCSAGVGRTGTYIALDILTREGRATGHVDVFGCVTALRGQRVCMVQTAEQYKYLHNALVHSLTLHCDQIPASRVRELLTENNDGSLQAQYQYLNQSRDNISNAEKNAVEANKAETRKNRRGADIPGNRHRPKLSALRKSGYSNYINAVYVNSFKERNRYIVAQTPLVGTVVDFLSLVMQRNCSCVVSLDFENNKNTDAGAYFTPDKMSKFGMFEVTCRTRETTPQHVLRQLDINARGQQGLQQWSVPHVQCTVWGPNASVPSNAMAFLQLVIEVDRISAESGHSGPIIVHCLTGAERSGLFCVVSNLVEKMAIEHQVSVVNTVRQVTARRRNAIPDQDQYRFCYQCLVDYLQSFETYSNFSL